MLGTFLPNSIYPLGKKKKIKTEDGLKAFPSNGHEREGTLLVYISHVKSSICLR